MQNAIANGRKHTAKEYAEAIDFMKRRYDSYKEGFEDIMGFYPHPVQVLP